MKYVIIAAVVVANDALVLIGAFVNAIIFVEYDIICMILMGWLLEGQKGHKQTHTHSQY